MKRILPLLTVLLTFVCAAAFSAGEDALPPACTPSNHMDVDWWKERHEANKERIARGNVDLLLIGDSITHGWDGCGKPVFDYYYGDRNCVNMGFGGDQTGDVLWRLSDAPMEKIHPKAAMLLIGINNLWVACNQNPADVSLGIKMIVEKLESLYPDIKILVLFTFVVGPEGEQPTRSRTALSNALVLDLLRGDPQVVIKDINYIWLDEANRVPAELMGDFVHPTELGYWRWAAAVEPEIAEMLGTGQKQAPQKN